MKETADCRESCTSSSTCRGRRPGHRRASCQRDAGTSPLVIRRTMAGLRELSLVRSEKGHGGGWTIAQDLTTATPRNVYETLWSPGIFAMGNHTEASGCLVEAAVNAAVDGTFARRKPCFSSASANWRGLPPFPLGSAAHVARQACRE
ncbi:MAG: Rrf2 family transcriptional regulator [Aurantimonas endophytica]|uniref:Rrf2 family transcriptional regulator n=1 Tax=Aurantimonas endophytica TaxID=1522175 RepID=UPI0030035C28